MQTYWLQTLYEYRDKGDTHYTVDFMSVMSGCFNITMNCLYVKLFKVLISCGSHNNTY